ncbi:MAG: phosphotriesterase [Lunatimonas sp.]|uniref:phosphotriesterase family protein n=1 Tax=Lunatimonas sp. TaxID=2060141 RepID=UPI002A3942F9|nr:phosphotriesterase [Lunatimonas sp.]
MRSYLLLIAFYGICYACTPPETTHHYIETVQGPLEVSEMGKTLIHEHLLVDFIGASDYHSERWERSQVIDRVLPFLQEIKDLGFTTLVECTPEFLGRDPGLLQELSQRSGIQLLTNTGLYGAVDNKYLPEYAFTESADQLAARWIAESQEGIAGTGIKPGFIKISVNPGPLSPLHEKLVRAAAKTHQASGLLIVSHTGTALAAFAQMDVLKEEGVPEDAFVWVHAQAEEDKSRHVAAAKRGAWVSFDGISEENLDQYLSYLLHMKQHDVLNRTLLSHDAGWYSPGEENGGSFRGFTTLSERFIPLLLANGFSEMECEQLVIKNPANAFRLSSSR